MAVTDQRWQNLKPDKHRTRGRPRLAEVADLENRLMDIALKEFLKNGFGGTSMATIVKAAGISKTTLYSRFSSKKDLFDTIMRSTFDPHSRADDLVGTSSDHDLAEGLRAIAIRSLEEGMRDRVIGIDRLIYAEADRFPNLGKASAETNLMLRNKLCEFIADCAVREGVACKNPDRPAELFAQMIRGVHAIAVQSGRKMSEDEIRQWADRAVETLLTSRKDW